MLGLTAARALQGGEHGTAHGVGLDDFTDGKFIGKFPNRGHLPMNFPSSKSSFKKKVINSAE